MIYIYKRVVTSIVIIFGLFILGWLGIQALVNPNDTYAIDNSDLLRFHVLANSDSPRDQAIKRVVRDEVLKTTGALFNKAQDAEEARVIATKNLRKIEHKANSTLSSMGVSYGATAIVEDWEFPVRRYGDLVLPAGKYPAVRVLLGKAQGQNWWCVLFPPLCFKDFDSGFAISETQKVSAKRSLAEYKKTAKKRPSFRFTLRSIENPRNGLKGHLVWKKGDTEGSNGIRKTRHL